MSGTPGLVADVLPSSWVDGPGNRFVVFMQGCDFNCVACHNPHTITPCTSCGDCVVTCPTAALSFGPDGVVLWDQERCGSGDACLATCPIDSTPKARWTRVPDLVEQIRASAPFISGITVSGGEATQQHEFVAELFHALAVDAELSRLSRLVDTNAGATAEVWDRLIPVTDGFLVDLKAFDPEVHERTTGRPLAPVLRSIRHLSEHDRLAEIRMLIMTGINDDPATLVDAARWLSAVAPGVRIQLTGFRAHGVRPSALPLVEPDPARLELLADLMAAAGARRPIVV